MSHVAIFHDSPHAYYAFLIYIVHAHWIRSIINVEKDRGEHGDCGRDGEIGEKKRMRAS